MSVSSATRRRSSRCATTPFSSSTWLAEHGSFGAYLADWPAGDIFGLWADIKRRGDRLGGHTGGYFLRFIGKDTPMFSRDVIKALIDQGVVDKEPTSKRDLAAAPGGIQPVARGERPRTLRDFPRACLFGAVISSGPPEEARR